MRARIPRLTFFLCAFAIAQSALAADRVSVMRTPNGGIQPQAVVDPEGTIHLIYYKGNERAGDIFYAREKVNEKSFSKPIQVNSRPGSAMAIGTIRGAQLAIGRNGRAHVAWNGGDGAAKALVRGEEATPMVYTRLNDAGTAFEPERNVLTTATGLDGGGSVAADQFGNVYVVWHGRGPNAAEGEAGRAVYIAKSTNEGQTFASERPAIEKATGACGCCGMGAFAGADGSVYLLYRAVSDKVDRAEVLLVTPKPGSPFQIANSDPWKVEGCPMSSASFSQGADRTIASWETAGQVFYGLIDPKTKELTTKLSPPGQTKRKHPVAVSNAKGEMLMAWTEGTGWNKGGTVAWQLFDTNGAPVSKGSGDGLPVWGLVAAFTRPDGEFVVVY